MNIQLQNLGSEVALVHKSLSDQFLTEVKVKKVALTVFGVLFSFFACATISATLTGVIPLPLALFSIPFLVFSHKAFLMESQIKDYGDVFSLQQMQEAARWMSFSKLKEEHGGLTHLLLYKVITPLDLRHKFISEYENVSLSQLLKEFPLSYIKKYGLASDLQLREKLCIELSETLELKTLYENFKNFEKWELENFNIISSDENLKLRELLEGLKKVEEEKQKGLIQIHTRYFERRDNILKDLERQALETDEFKAVFDEKERFYQDESLGRTQQMAYEQEEKQIEQVYIKQKNLIKKQLLNFLEFDFT